MFFPQCPAAGSPVSRERVRSHEAANRPLTSALRKDAVRRSRDVSCVSMEIESGLSGSRGEVQPDFVQHRL